MVKATSLDEIGEALGFIVERMATKADLKGFASSNDVRAIFREEVKDLRADVKDIRKQLDELNNKVDNIAGYRKEIDYALERVAAIEKHLGIKRKIAA